MLQLVRKTRTVRKFQEQQKIEKKTLEELLELARLSGSARNSQPLCYALLTEPEHCNLIFPLLGWAGYLKDWRGPAPGERPVAYIICCVDKERLKGPIEEAYFDLGIASQNMLLGAAEQGILGCRIGNFSKTKLQQILQFQEHYMPLLVMALGYPAEEVVLEKLGADGDIRYWRTADGTHHVPKRELADCIIPLSL